MCVSGGLMARRYMNLRQSEAEYESLRQEMAEDAVLPEAAASAEPEDSVEAAPMAEEDPKEEEAPAYRAPQALLDMMDSHPDMIGWLSIEGTKVDYPVMQNADNQYYLHRDIDGNDAVAGSIYMDSAHDISERGLHTVYGHHMKNGTMFKDVSRFIDSQYLQEHQQITLTTDERELHLKPVYCYAGPADSTYRSRISSHAELVQFITDHTGLEIDADDLYVLITCSYGSEDERTYLYCVPEEM